MNKKTKQSKILLYIHFSLRLVVIMLYSVGNGRSETNEQNYSKVFEISFSAEIIIEYLAFCEKHLSNKIEDRCKNYLDRIRDDLILSCGHV